MKQSLEQVFADIRKAAGPAMQGGRGAWKKRTIPRGRPMFVVNRASGRVLGFALGVREARGWLKRNGVPEGLCEIVRDFEEFRELFLLNEAVDILEGMGVVRDWIGMDNVVHAWAWEGMHRTAGPLGEFVLEGPKGIPWVVSVEMVEYTTRTDVMVNDDE